MARTAALKIPAPTESQEQIALFEWARLQSGKYPELKLMFAIPNGSFRHKATAGRLKAEGVKAGVPDLCLPVARGCFHGAYFELKRSRGGAVSEEQNAWMNALIEQGYFVCVCRWWMQAAAAIVQYLSQ